MQPPADTDTHDGPETSATGATGLEPHADPEPETLQPPADTDTHDGPETSATGAMGLEPHADPEPETLQPPDDVPVTATQAVGMQPPADTATDTHDGPETSATGAMGLEPHADPEPETLQPPDDVLETATPADTDTHDGPETSATGAMGLEPHADPEAETHALGVPPAVAPADPESPVSATKSGAPLIKLTLSAAAGCDEWKKLWSAALASCKEDDLLELHVNQVRLNEGLTQADWQFGNLAGDPLCDFTAFQYFLVSRGQPVPPPLQAALDWWKINVASDEMEDEDEAMPAETQIEDETQVETLETQPVQEKQTEAHIISHITRS